MIFVDASEIRSTSLTRGSLPDGYKPIDGLEDWTGGDVMISVADLPMPVNKALARMHIKQGAIVVQIKHGHDLTSSVGTRMNDALTKMQGIGCKPWQSVLLFVGFLSRGNDGEALVNNHKAHGGENKKWHQVQSAIDFWMYRGGVYNTVNSVKLLSDWLSLQEAHLIKVMKSPEKVFFPETPVMYGGNGEFDPLQPLRKISDFRATLLTVPGLGVKRVNNLYQWMAMNGKPLTLRGAIECCVKDDREIIKDVPLWGDATIESVWRWYNTESDIITIQAMEEK